MNARRTWEASVGWVTAVAVAGFVGSACAGAEDPTSGPADLETRSAALSTSCGEESGVRVMTGSTGRIEISDFFVGGTFYVDDTILRTDPCVAHLENPDEPRTAAGTLTVTSDLVGTPGGPLAPLVINPDTGNDYFEFPDPPLFNYPDGTRVQIQLSGAPGFPPILHRTVRSSPFDLIAFDQPEVPASGVLPVSSAAALALDWTVPEGARRAPHQSIAATLLVLGPTAWGNIYCSWPLAEGHGEVPTAILREFRARLGGTGALDGAFDIFSGEFRELRTATSSYVILVGSDLPQSSIPRSTPVLFD
jgi:hypothetical protein